VLVEWYHIFMLILNIIKLPLLIHLFKIVKQGKEKKLPMGLRDTFINFGMEKEIIKLSFSSKMSVVVTTANSELV